MFETSSLKASQFLWDWFGSYPRLRETVITYRRKRGGGEMGKRVGMTQDLLSAALVTSGAPRSQPGPWGTLSIPGAFQISNTIHGVQACVCRPPHLV